MTLRPVEIGAGILLAAGTLLVFQDPLLAMMHRWDVSPMYSYGYVVPVISAYLLWLRSDDFARAPLAPARVAGGAVVLGSLVLLAIGRVTAIQILEQLSFLITLAGIVLCLFGRRYLLLALPAIGYLLFAVPIWDAFTEPLHAPFQDRSARLGVAMMRAIDVPVFRDGTIIVLPNVTLEVARECSGVNYLVAVLALALPMSFLRLRTMWRRIALVLAAVIVSSLANGLRVALIGTLAYLEIGSPLHGPFHVLHGLFVAAIGFVVIFVGLRLLEEQPSADITAAVAERTSEGRAWRPGDALGLATLFLALAFVGVAPQARAVAIAKPLDQLPLQILNWNGWTSPFVDSGRGQRSSPATAWGGADHILSRIYRTPGGEAITLDVFYFEAQRQNHEMISSASAEMHRDAASVEVGSGAAAFRANVLQWRDRNETALFWYEIEGQPEAGQLATKLATIRRSLFNGRSDGAAIVLRTRTHPDATTALQGFAQALRPAVAELLRGNTTEH